MQDVKSAPVDSLAEKSGSEEPKRQFCWRCGRDLPREGDYCDRCGVRQCVPTGIKGLDALLLGGFEEGKTYLVSGQTGSGKTVFCMQYLACGLSKGESSVYVTTDQKPDHLLAEALGFGWDFRNSIEKGKLMLLDLSAEFSKEETRKGVGPARAIEELRPYIERVSAKRLAIDSLASLFSVLENKQKIGEEIRRALFALDEFGTTNVVTSFVKPGSNALSLFGVEELLASGVIVLKLLRRGAKYERHMEILKMRTTPYVPSMRKFTIEREVGILVGPEVNAKEVAEQRT